VFHGLKTGFFYSLKLNFICYLNRFFTFDYSLWEKGRHTFLRAKTNFNPYLSLKATIHIVMAKLPIPENCSAYASMILKEFCSSKIKTFSWK
jgi:hypothetical protein